MCTISFILISTSRTSYCLCVIYTWNHIVYRFNATRTYKNNRKSRDSSTLKHVSKWSKTRVKLVHFIVSDCAIWAFLILTNIIEVTQTRRTGARGNYQNEPSSRVILELSSHFSTWQEKKTSQDHEMSWYIVIQNEPVMLPIQTTVSLMTSYIAVNLLMFFVKYHCASSIYSLQF